MTVDDLRAETRACGEGLIHLNNAGASLMPDPVHAAVADHLALEAEIGGYEAKDRMIDAVENFYPAAARLVGGAPDEIAFIENATRAWDMAFYAFDWKAGDRILTSAADYDSNMIAYLQVARRYGAEVTVVPDGADGAIDPDALEAAMDGTVKLIAITHVPTNNGLVAPVEAVGKIARAHGVPYLLDACQSVGQMPVDVEKIGCDMLSTTGRKYIRGPRGTGFLWVRRDWIGRLEPPFLDNHAAKWTAPGSFEIRPDARRFENWESYYAGKIGLGVALDYAHSVGMDWAWTRITALADRLRNGLSAIKGVTRLDTGSEKCGIVMFRIVGQESDAVVRDLRTRRLNLSSSTPQLTRDDIEQVGNARMLRASVHYFNTDEEVDTLLDTVDGLAASAR